MQNLKELATKWMPKPKKLMGVSTPPISEVKEDLAEVEEAEEDSVDLEIVKVSNETKAKAETSLVEEANPVPQDPESRRLSGSSGTANSVARTMTWVTA